jgi:hypothetical protein
MAKSTSQSALRGAADVGQVNSRWLGRETFPAAPAHGSRCAYGVAGPIPAERQALADLEWPPNLVYSARSRAAPGRAPGLRLLSIASARGA